MSSAPSRVFGIPELLEIILAELPPRDLLVFQRVSRIFRAVIQSSAKYQRALFFQNDPFKDPKEWTLNPLLRDPFLPWFVMCKGPENLPSHDVFGLLDWAKDDKTRDAFLRSEASWRRMLIIQPSPRDLLITNQFCPTYWRNAKPDLECKISFQDLQYEGVTMDALYDFTIGFVEFYKRGRFRINFVVAGPDPARITLKLFRITRDRKSEVHLKSQSSNIWNFTDLDFKVPIRNIQGFERMKIRAKQGGVPLIEFEKWKQERSVQKWERERSAR